MVAEPVDFVARRRMMAVGQRTMAPQRVSAGIFGEAQRINARLKQMRLAGNARDFLDHLTTKTLNWGGDEARGRDIYATEISTAAWGQELREDTCNSVWTTSNIKHMIDKLTAHGIITYEPDYERPGYGVIAWNRNLEEWQPFDRGGKREGAGSGGTRPGAGRPINQSSVQSLPGTENQSSVQRTIDKNQSSVQPESIKCTTDDCLEGSGSAVSSTPLRSDQETRIKKRDANASGDAAIAPVAKRGKPSSPPKEKQARRPREPDPYWEALVALCGPAEGRESLYQKTITAIKEMGGTPEEIPIRANNWHRLFPGATRTINAIRNHWHELANDAVEAELARQAAAKAAEKRGATNGQHQPVPATQAVRGRARRGDPNEGIARIPCPGDDD